MTVQSSFQSRWEGISLWGGGAGGEVRGGPRAVLFRRLPQAGWGPQVQAGPCQLICSWGPSCTRVLLREVGIC